MDSTPIDFASTVAITGPPAPPPVIPDEPLASRRPRKGASGRGFKPAARELLPGTRELAAGGPAVPGGRTKNRDALGVGRDVLDKLAARVVVLPESVATTAAATRLPNEA